MITVTDNAVNQLRTMLAGRDDADRAGLRLFVERGGCSGLQYSMQFDEVHPGDETVERDGVRVFVEGASASHLRGSVLDYYDGLTGTGFRIENPNAVRTCGCGTSFEPSTTAESAAPAGVA